jgi:hypothetical protein
MGSSSTRQRLSVRPERIRLDGGRRIMEAQDYPGTSSRWELKVSGEGGCIRITAGGIGAKTWKIRLQLPENISLRLLQALCLLLGSGGGARVVLELCEADSGRGCANFMDHRDVEACDSSIALVAFTDLSVYRSCRLDGPLCVANDSTVTRCEANSAELYKL